MEPNEMDVLCSKGKSVLKNPGNILFRERIEASTPTYAGSTNKQEKMKITKDIVSYMQIKHGSRFLKKKGTGWVEINNLSARDKVSHALRFAANQCRYRQCASAASSKKTPTQSPHNRASSIGVGSQSSSSCASSHSSGSSQSRAEEKDQTTTTIAPTTTPEKTNDIVEVHVASIYMHQEVDLANKDILDRYIDDYFDFEDFERQSLERTKTFAAESTTLRSEDLSDLLLEIASSNLDEWDEIERLSDC